MGRSIKQEVIGLLSDLNLPADIKKLSLPEKIELCSEIRSFLINSVTKNGGHLASSLGTVELTVALHSAFFAPDDKIIWDVGHQAYAHKILTGRYNDFHTLRKENGISGFPRPCESEYDAFVGGHSSISISAAVGIAAAAKMNGETNKAVAVIGDGAFTGGMAFEGLNNASKCGNRLVIVLNENQMSISKNVGAVARYLSSIRTSKGYFNAKTAVKRTFDKTPLFGEALTKAAHTTKSFFKQAIYKNNIFEEFGLYYIGPVDGHDLEQLTVALEIANSSDRPCLVHVFTVKGKGYKPAEDNPGAFHGLSRFTLPQTDTYSDVFGKELTRLADSDDRICAITAAMKYGTGLQHFSAKHKNRFFDVGIAEQHAVTFSCGLASHGYVPVFAVYSTFLQRSTDQIINDGAIEKYHIVLGVDRAGFVGEDGETHQGLFDVSLLGTVPNTTIYSPAGYGQLRKSLHKALYIDSGVVAIRYPRGYEAAVPSKYQSLFSEYSDFVYINNNSAVLAVTYGRLSAVLTNLLEEQTGFDVLCLNRISPLPEKTEDICKEYRSVLFFEEGMLNGGIAQRLLYLLVRGGYKGDYDITAVDSCFVKQAKVMRQLEMFGLDRQSISDRIKQEVIKTGSENERET